MTISTCKSKRALVVIGAGGFGAEAAWVAEEMNLAMQARNGSANPLWEFIGFADADPEKRGSSHFGYAVHGPVELMANDSMRSEIWYFCAIGDNNARQKMVHLAEGFGWKAATLVHPSAVLAGNVSLGEGCYIGPGSFISVNAVLGCHVITNVHVSIGHDSVLGNFCQISPGARISGGCNIGPYALIGSNATLMPGTRVGECSIVGANSLAHGEVEPRTTVSGVPARTIRRIPPLESQPVVSRDRQVSEAASS